MLKPVIAVTLLAVSMAHAQAPRAGVVADPALVADAGQDFFQRGKNLYDAAQHSPDPRQKLDLYLKAIEIFSNYLVDFPKHANSERALWYLGSSFHQTGQAQESKRCFSTLINRYGKGPWVGAAAYALAADHYNRAEYAMAAPLFERYAANTEKPEECARATYYSGNCYRLLGRDREATVAFQKVAADPAGEKFHPQVKLALGHLAMKAGQTEKAFALFEEVSMSPQAESIQGEALLNGALAAKKLGKREVAVRNLELILRTPSMGDQWPSAQSALMANYFDEKQYDKVINVFRGSASKGTGEEEASRLMIAARAYMRLKQPDEALDLFREVEKLVRPDSDIAFRASYFRLMCFFQIKGEHVPDQVDAFLQLYQKSRPNDSRVHTALMMKAESLYAAGKVADAAQVYNTVDVERVSEQNRPGLLYQRGWCLADAGDAVGSAKSLSLFITRYPDDLRIPTALAKRAKMNADGSKTDQAIADYDRLIALGKPADLYSYAWLESARLRRVSNEIPDMIRRYRGLLEKVSGLDENLQAEANYWIGWGMVKTNQAKSSIPYLEKSRGMRPDVYRKHAGILLALGYFSAQDAEKLSAEVELAIKGGYASDLPDQVLQWGGIQAFNAGMFDRAAKFLGLIATPDEPRATPKEVWRYLAKSRLEIRDAKEALVAVDHVLAVEDNAAWKADGLLDRARALYALDRNAESRKAVDEALALQPQGRTRGSLRILSGDLEMRAGDSQKASAQYLIVVSFIDDSELKPLALFKLAKAMDAQGNAAEAEKYRAQLKSGFPDWKDPS